MNSPTQALSQYIAKTTFEDIPENVVEEAKDCILDSLGCAVGGATLQPGKVIIDFFTDLGGHPEASVLATGKKLPCIHTAYVNSYLANLLDFDDTSTRPLAHPGATIIPPGLALAEKIGASGRDLITAIVIAYEAWGRIAQAIASSPERQAKVWGMSTHQIFGAAIVSAKLLKFDAEQIANALGLAGVSAPVPNCRKLGVELEDRPISWAKNNFGWASMGGVLAACLTEKGFKGNKHILDGERGFWLMASSDQCDFEKITLNLGTDYLISQTGFKPYASCRMTHSSLDAIVEIMAKHKADVNKIKTIKVNNIAEVAETFGVHNPASILDAQFSLPHLIALELLGKSPSKGLSDDDLTDPMVRSLAERVSIEPSSELEKKFCQNGLLSAMVSIELTDGSLYSKRVDIPKWSATSRPTRRELQDKFIRLTAPTIGSEAADAIVEDIEQLANLRDISIMISEIDQNSRRRSNEL